MRRIRHFTLVELMLVMAIIALLSGLILGMATYASRRAADSKTQSRLNQLEIAIEQYRQDRGHLPQAATPREVNWDDEDFKNSQGVLYLQKYPVDSDSADNNIYEDGRGEPFWYECPGTMNPQSYDLWSMGKDEQHGDGGGTGAGNAPNAQNTAAQNSDDITNWKRN